MVRFAPDAAVRVVRLAPAVVLRAAFAVFAAAVRAAPCPLVFAFDPAERELERVVELVRERADDDEDPLRERPPRAEPEVLLLPLPDFVRARAISVSSFV